MLAKGTLVVDKRLVGDKKEEVSEGRTEDAVFEGRGTKSSQASFSRGEARIRTM